MNNRRQFLQTTAASLSGGVPVPLQPVGASGNPAGSDLEPLYLGKPMRYWLARLGDGDYDPVDTEVMERSILWNFGQAAVPGLIEALGCGAAGRARVELSFLATPETVRALTEALGHPLRNVRVEAAQTLGSFASRQRAVQDAELTRPLRKAMTALAALVRSEPCPSLAEQAAMGFHCLNKTRDSGVPFPTAVADWGGLAPWAAVVRAYPEHFEGPAVAPLLAPLLTVAEPAARLAAAEALSNFRPDHPGIVPVFVEHAIDRPDDHERRFANVDRFIDKALPALRDALAGGTVRQRALVAEALGWSDSTAVLPLLAEAARDEAEPVRMQAVHSLQCLDNPAVVPLLVAALQDPAAGVRRQARQILKRRPRCAQRALPELVELLERGAPEARLSAALAMCGLRGGWEPAVPPLRRNLEHDAPDVRLGAAIALARLEHNGQDHLEILAAGMVHPEHDVRGLAIAALQQIGPAAEAVLPQILAGIERERSRGNPHRSAGTALSVLSELRHAAAPAVDLLVGWLADPELDLHLRGQLQMALARIGEPAIDPLLGLVQGDDPVAAIRAVTTLGHVAAAGHRPRYGSLGEALLPAARSFRPQEWDCLLSKRLLPLMVDLLRRGGPAFRVAAAEALGAIGPSAAFALPLLRHLAHDRDILLRRRAEEAVTSVEKKPEVCPGPVKELVEKLARLQAAR